MDALSLPPTVLRPPRLKAKTKHIVVYDDSTVFGGHEALALEGLRALILEGDFSLTVIYSKANVKFEDGLMDLLPLASGRLMLRPRHWASNRFQALSNYWARAQIKQLAALLRELKPDRVLALQGDIELSSQVILAAKKCAIPCISYLALPHSRMCMGAKFGWLRDRLNPRLYGQPEAFITLSERMAKLLEDRGALGPVAIVPNGIDFERLHFVSRAHACADLGLPQDRKILGMVGRVEFKQKGHAWMLKALEAHWEQLSGFHWVVVGDGPDRKALQALVAKSSWKHDFTWLPWRDDLSAVYAALDVLMIPSRFEGVPLVMLEAMHQKVPIVATKRDGMQEYLPESWLFNYHNAQQCHDAIKRVMSEDQTVLLQKNYDRVFKECSMTNFRRHFVAAVRGFME